MNRQTILITGASSGLGLGMALEYAKQGKHLALCARRMENLESLKVKIESSYPNAKVSIKSLDVNDHDAVFRVFKEFKSEMGSLDRVIVNAGMGKGASIGKGFHHANVATAQTNFVAAVVQAEAALEIFREQNAGHLVTISSFSALRGFPGALTVYAATKAALTTFSEGLRVDLRGSPIRVSCIHPGFIRSEINEKVKNMPFLVDLETGCKSMVKAIDKEKPNSFVPRWPWEFLKWGIRIAPLSVLAKMG